MIKLPFITQISRCTFPMLSAGPQRAHSESHRAPWDGTFNERDRSPHMQEKTHVMIQRPSFKIHRAGGWRRDHHGPKQSTNGLNRTQLMREQDTPKRVLPC